MIFEFAAHMVAFRRNHAVFSRRRFLQERTLVDGVKEPHLIGGEFAERYWFSGHDQLRR